MREKPTTTGLALAVVGLRRRPSGPRFSTMMSHA
jgi:hypothetical protein